MLSVGILSFTYGYLLNWNWKELARLSIMCTKLSDCMNQDRTMFLRTGRSLSVLHRISFFDSTRNIESRASRMGGDTKKWRRDEKKKMMMASAFSS